MDIHVMVVPETSDFLFPVLRENKVWITYGLGKPNLKQWNAKYVAPYWLGENEHRGVNRIFQILGDVTESEDGDSYEIKLGDSLYMPENWTGLDNAQVRRFQYVPLNEFKLRENRKGELIPFSVAIRSEENVREVMEVESETIPMEKNVQNSKFFEEFWIGKNINIAKYWKAYHQGEGYMQKFKEMKCHVIEITFKKFPLGTPLFNLEPIYKTLKSHYYNVKKTYLSEEEFNSAGPLFLYEINRSSEKWTLLGELPYALIFGTTLTAEQIKGQVIDNTFKKLEGYKQYFGEINVRKELFMAYMKANTPDEFNDAIYNIIQENVEAIKISKHPVINGNIEETKKEMLDITKNELPPPASV